MLAVVILATGTGTTRGAIVGPDSFGYRATNDVPYAFLDIRGTGTRTLAGQDDLSITVPLGFSFNFYGRDFTQASFNPNGLISFGGGANWFANRPLATWTFGSGLAAICVLHDDWQFRQAGSDGAYYQTVGSPGSRQFIVQWNMTYGVSSSPSGVTFEAVLFEGTNDVLLQYADVDSGDSRRNGASATVGIKDNPSRGAGRYLQWSYNSPVISDGEAIRFTTHHTPEPASLIVWSLLAGLGGAHWWYRRRRRAG